MEISSVVDSCTGSIRKQRNNISHFLRVFHLLARRSGARAHTHTQVLVGVVSAFCGILYHLLQHFENWACRLLASFQFNTWLYSVHAESGQKHFAWHGNCFRIFIPRRIFRLRLRMFLKLHFLRQRWLFVGGCGRFYQPFDKHVLVIRMRMSKSIRWSVAIQRAHTHSAWPRTVFRMRIINTVFHSALLCAWKSICSFPRIGQMKWIKWTARAYHTQQKKEIKLGSRFDRSVHAKWGAESSKPGFNASLTRSMQFKSSQMMK